MSHGEVNHRSKSGLFSGNLKSLVGDMKFFKRSSRRRERREGGETSSSRSTPVSGSTPVLESTPVPERPSTITTEKKPISSRSPRSAASLSVQVTITFDEPLNYSYTRNYETSPSLQPTERLCQGLLRRIDHCCHELITRKDSTAMDYAAGNDVDKPLRFEIQIDIIRGWTEIWASRTFKSYQKQRLSAESARDIILSTHHIIGLFLRCHDDGFVWKDGPVRENPSQEQETYSQRPGKVQPMSCVPRSFFLEKSQSFESIPGYTIKFALTSKNQRCKPPEWHRTIEVNSNQTSPLNSIGAESLFFKASYALEGLFKLQREVFDDHHRSCVSSDGCKLCRQHDDNDLKLQLSLVNNLGPQFPHLERTVSCKGTPFSQSQAQDCLDFVNMVETDLLKVRDEADHMINGINDLEFRITELRSRGWALEEPLVFPLNPISPYSQRDTEAILDRLQAGVASVLRGNATSVRMQAYKRGHFILDKTFVTREPLELVESKKTKASRKPQSYVLDRLRQRIERDIDIICKDTCTLDDSDDEAETPSKAPVTVAQQSVPDQHLDTATPLIRVNTATSASQHTSEQVQGSLYTQPSLKIAEDTESVRKPVDVPVEEHVELKEKPLVEETESLRKSVNIPVEEHGELKNKLFVELTKKLVRGPVEQPERETEEGHEEEPNEKPGESYTTSTPGPIRKPSTSIFCSNTGARAFPLVPGLDEYSDLRRTVQTVSTRVIPITIFDSLIIGEPEQPSDSTSIHTAELRNKERVIATRPKGEPEPGKELEQPREAGPKPERAQERTYESPRVSPAPSLVFGGGHSPASSLLITPKVYGSNAEVGIFKNNTVDSDGESIRSDTGKKLFKRASTPSPTLRRVGLRAAPSPLHQDDSLHEANGLGILDGDILPRPEDSQVLTQIPDRAPPAVPDTERILDAPTPENKPGNDNTTGTTVGVSSDLSKTNIILPQDKREQTEESSSSDKVEVPSHAEHTDADGNMHHSAEFSQSKPDFAFSSPPDITPEGSFGDDGHAKPSITVANPDPSEDLVDDIPPSPQLPPLTHSSAGYLGFHEQRFSGINFRSALMRTPPGSSHGDNSRPSTPT
ncbi:hypothetical protein F5B20DRAFT_597039 [Whalleya microplaca]|nr:hypothetical protein F5B20DRAFT_597039 [Whalleya microplaca]